MRSAVEVILFGLTTICFLLSSFSFLCFLFVQFVLNPPSIWIPNRPLQPQRMTIEVACVWKIDNNTECIEKQYKRVGIIIYYISSSERLVLIRTIFIKKWQRTIFVCFLGFWKDFSNTIILSIVQKWTWSVLGWSWALRNKGHYRRIWF